MEYGQAMNIAHQVIQTLKHSCDFIAVAGSLRRGKPFVNDIDIVCIPRNQGEFIVALQSLGKFTMGGQKNIRVQLPHIMLDVYVADKHTWATLLLIRTGSKSHNIRLCSLAKQKGMQLKADGSGLFRLTDCSGASTRIAGDSEESIFKALGLEYVPPERRE